MTEKSTEFTLKEILDNNNTEFSRPLTDPYTLMDVDMLYKLTIIGLGSDVDQMGMEVGNAAARELSRRAQIAAEVLNRLPENG
jgi:hypothetical protein